MKAKHPEASNTSDLSTQKPDLPTDLSVAPKEVRKAIQSFRKGSSGGWEGLCPQHLLDLTARCLGESATLLLEALTRFINGIMQGSLPCGLAEVFFGARLIALKKKCGGIRPIAVGLTQRRLVGKLCNSKVMGDALLHLGPQQLGYGVKRGSEATIHALRSFFATRIRV